MNGATWREYERWLAARGTAHTTVALYRRRCRACDRWLHATRNRCIRNATLDDLTAWWDTLPTTPQSRNLARKALTSLGGWLIDTRRRTHWHADQLPRLRERQGVPRPLPQPERVMAAAARVGPQARVLVSSMLLAGLRFTEARTLEWGSWQGEWLYITGKGGQAAVLPCHAALAEALSEWRMRCQSPRWVHPSPIRSGRPVGETWLRGLWREVAETAALAGVTPHQARHRFATDALRITHDLATVQDLLRHASPQTTRGYTRVETASLAAAVARLDYTR